MPYPKDRKQSSKQRILSSATELFCQYGFDRVSIGQIMSLARMTHGAFYAHFESKEALFKASLSETFKRTRAHRLAKAPFSIRHLIQLVNHHLSLRNLSEQQPGPEMILFNEIGAERKEIRQLYEQSYLSLLKLLETRITALVRLNKIRLQGDIADRARSILASLVGAVAIARSIDNEAEQKRILLVAQDQILQLIGARAELAPIDVSMFTTSKVPGAS